MSALFAHGHGRPRWVWAIGALLFMHMILALPAQPGSVTWTAFGQFPLELAIMILILFLVPSRLAGAKAIRVLASSALCLFALLKIADLAMYAILERPFNLAYDAVLVHAGWMLLVGTSGILAASLCLVAGLIALALMLWLAWWAVGTISALRPQTGRWFVCSLILLATGVLVSTGHMPAASSKLARKHVSAVLTARAEIALLRQEAARDDALSIEGAALGALKGNDIFFIFVESYGRSTLDNPLYAATTRSALHSVQTDLAANGLKVRSAWLTSPTVGGQSWLAHASLLSGLWIDSQGRYRALLGSRRSPLTRIASQNGWRSIAVMPAITRAWPEASYFGYDRVLAAADLGYAGRPFNWVTMPDQYTLSAFERLELDEPERGPVFAELALISSHAPWTPIPKLVPWQAIGEGTIFDRQALSGETPQAIWKDHARVRDQFRQSIEYVLRTVGSFAVRRADRPPLIVVLGDHQPAGFVSGDPTNRDVPIHLIGEDGVLSLFKTWNWTAGAIPAPDAPVWRMNFFRERFLDATSVPSPEPGPNDEHTAPLPQSG